METIADRTTVIETEQGCSLYRYKTGRDTSTLVVHSPAGDRIPMQTHARVYLGSPSGVEVDVIVSRIHQDKLCIYKPHLKILIMPGGEVIRCATMTTIESVSGRAPKVRVRIPITR